MIPHDNKRARLLPSATFDGLDNDLLIQCASYLDADGLAQLGRTSARFGIPQAGQQRSLVNETAHKRFQQSATDEERSCLPKYVDESDVGLYRALALLRQPLCFDELVGGAFGPQEHPASVTFTGRGSWSTAMSGHVMRGGRHFVEFAITKYEHDRQYIYLGAIRPVSLTNDMDLEDDWGGVVQPSNCSSRYKSALAKKLRSQCTGTWGENYAHCCAYEYFDGQCSWTNWYDDSDWGSSFEMSEGSGTIGLLLDLDEGTLSVFKNGRRLGVVKKGLGGEYCWFITACSACVRMSKGRAPE